MNPKKQLDDKIKFMNKNCYDFSFHIFFFILKNKFSLAILNFTNLHERDTNSKQQFIDYR